MDDKFSAPLWDPALLAEYLGLTKDHLARLRRDGGGPPFIKFAQGRASKIRYRKEAVLAWLRDHEYTSTSDHTVKNKDP